MPDTEEDTGGAVCELAGVGARTQGAVASCTAWQIAQGGAAPGCELPSRMSSLLQPRIVEDNTDPQSADALSRAGAASPDGL
jgi:hypothetical protein